MSKINIIRAVENIRPRTTVYTPLVEAIVNAIDAVEEKEETNGAIEIIVERSRQIEADNIIPPVESFLVKDNGIGFTDKNRDSFDTLYTDHKISQGGKGFGRFSCLKYFNDFKIESIYLDEDSFKERKFEMGKETDIIVNEELNVSHENDSRTIVKLANIKDNRFTDKKLITIARELVERLLPYFINEDYDCPTITISEADGSGKFVLNDLTSNQLSDLINEIELLDDKFILSGNNGEYKFITRLFKFYSPKNKHSKISLVAHRREVTDNEKRWPRLSEQFFSFLKWIHSPCYAASCEGSELK